MKTVLLLSFVFLGSIQVIGQFNSGSTGADGALDLSTMTCPGTVCRVQIPESGVFNFTTVNIPTNRSLVFIKNSRNTPVTILAQGSVSVGAGIISVDQPRYWDGTATFREPGPGGFYAGDANRNGFGPGGGVYDPNNFELSTGRWVGPLSLIPLVGGSGGASAGCGGAGAIAIASSTSITISSGGSIRANSLISQFFCIPNAGSGGAIRLIADSINVAGSLEATGRNNGVIRLESNNLVFTGTSTPLAVQASINSLIVSPAMPRLTISSVGGFAVPSNSGSRFDLVDILLPNQLSDPVNVLISAQNIPVGTQVQVGFVSGSPNGTSTPCNLTGTLANSSCTATISNLIRTGGTYLLATAAFDPPASVAEFNPTGKNQIAKIVLRAEYGGSTRYKFLRADGSEIDLKHVSRELLKQIGM